MNTATMTMTQESAVWRLAPGQASRLPAADRARWLRVLDGEVWLTLDGAPGAPASDCWLRSGALLLLPAGCDAVLEGHPQASFQVLEPAAAPALNAIVASAPRRVRASAWRGWLQRWSLLSPAAPRAELFGTAS